MSDIEEDDQVDRLRAWLAAQFPDALEVRVDGFDRVELGHSAETLLVTITWDADGGPQSKDVVLRVCPPPPGLLPPYDLRGQFDILRALEPTPVRAPRALWFEGSGSVLGREFYVMERLDGAVFEQSVPEELASDPARVRRMTESLVEQVAALHTVDLRATGLDAIADGRDHLDRELDRWDSEIRRLQRGPLPALERLVESLRERQPDPCPRITLVHGDPKPGNFAFVDDDVSAVYDWELTTIGDPLADIGWVEVMWRLPVGLPTLPGALTADEFVARWEDLTGITAQHREWYRALQGLKMAVIMLSGAMLFDAGHSDDMRFVEMGYAVHFLTQLALGDLGVDPDVEPGPVMAREERVAAVREAADV
jgi:aminoglycoside phosphotransferase (APT) family kinase protein